MKAKAMTTSNTLKKAVKPIVVETISSTAEKAEKKQVFEKHVITGNLPVPEGMVRCIVLIDYKGMVDELYAGDIQDLPDRRYKSLVNRGMVKKYEGTQIPNKQR
jgi:hypothetical protein